MLWEASYLNIIAVFEKIQWTITAGDLRDDILSQTRTLFSTCTTDVFSVWVTYMSLIPGVSDSEESVCNAGDLGSIPESGRSPGEGNGYPLQYSCLENSRDRGAWWTAVHGIIKSQTRLSDNTLTMLQWAYIEDQGLVEVDLSAILERAMPKIVQTTIQLCSFHLLAR